MSKDNFCTPSCFPLSQPQGASNQGQISLEGILLRTNINTLVHSVVKTSMSAGNSPKDLWNAVSHFSSSSSQFFYACPVVVAAFTH